MGGPGTALVAGGNGPEAVGFIVRLCFGILFSLTIARRKRSVVLGGVRIFVVVWGWRDVGLRPGMVGAGLRDVLGLRGIRLQGRLFLNAACVVRCVYSFGIPCSCRALLSGAGFPDLLRVPEPLARFMELFRSRALLP